MSLGLARAATVPFWRSLKGKLVLFFLLLDVTTLAVMSLTVGFDATETVSRQSRERLQDSVRSTSLRLAEDLRTKWEQMQSISQNTLVINGVVDTLGREAYLRPFINKLTLSGRGREAPRFAMLDYKGRVITVNRSGDYPSGGEAWLAGVLQGQEYGGVFPGADGRPMVRFAFPVFYQNQVEGALLSEFSFSFVDELLASEQGVAAAVVDAQGSVLHGRVPPEVAQAASRHGQGAQADFREHARHLYGIAQLASPDGQAGLRWQLVLSVSTEEVVKPVAELIRRMLVAGLVSGLVVTLVVVWRARRFVDPLVQLQNTMQDIMDQGDMSKTVSISATDEVGALGGTFNRMMNQLRSQDENLRAEVSERRRAEEELRTANEALRATLDELQATQAQLVQSEKMASLGQLAAGVAHEINNPVGFVKSNLGTLRDYSIDLLQLVGRYEAAFSRAMPGESPASVAAFKAEVDFDFLRDDLSHLLDESDEGLDRVAKIVADLKDFAHADQHAMEEVDFNALLDKVINVARNELKYKAEVVRDYGVIPPVPCYPGRIGQVFLNLLVNAAQAIPQRGEIRVSTRAEADQLVVCVADTGSGIPPEIIGKIFDPFFTTKPVGQGTGLGLHIAYNIVHGHQGRIEVSSTPGAGTRFFVRLPLLATQQQATASAERQQEEPADGAAVG